MRLKTKINNIHRDKLKRKEYIRNEIKKIILKSIIQNLNISPIKRSLALKKLSYFKKISSISKQNNNICLKTGRNKGVLRITTLSRHYIKQLSLVGNLQNIKIKSW